MESIICWAQTLNFEAQTLHLPGVLFLGNPSQVTPLSLDALTEDARYPNASNSRVD